jgi:hypothetical protein
MELVKVMAQAPMLPIYGLDGHPQKLAARTTVKELAAKA